MSSEKRYRIKSQEYLRIYEEMLLLRRFEERCAKAYGMGKIGGFCHLYIGQEAVITGVNLARRSYDSMITSYRSHAHTIISGVDPKYVMAELMGRATGCSKGKGGSMHMFNASGNFYGGHGIVGAQVPIGTGLAFAEKYRNSDNLCFTFLGDGALSQGQVYEAFNMAALWNLPIIYVIENNQYAMGTSVHRSTSVVDLYKKGEVFGIKGIMADGMDFESVYNAACLARDIVRTEKIPMIVEVKTYRYKGHSMSDPGQYRSKEELQTYKDSDPIKSLREIIIGHSYSTKKDLECIERNVIKQVEEAYEFALNSPLPEEGELYTDIYK